MYPAILKKEMKEMKIVSVILFIGISAFILLFAGQLIFEGNSENKDKDISPYFTPECSLSSVKGLSMILVAYNFQDNIYPMYCSLKEKSN